MTQRVNIGVDLGGTHLRAALVSDAGVVTHRQCLTSSRTLTSEKLLAELQRLVADLARLACGDGVQLSALGIGLPAVINADGRITKAPNLPELNDAVLAPRLAELTGLPVKLCNDADAAALGELHFGAGRGLASFLMVTLGTGVGGALVLGGQLWHGSDGMAGEVGHVMVEPQGRVCGCGSHGCLEQYASATGIVTTARELLSGDIPTRLDKRDAQHLTSATLAEAALKGDEVACAAYAEAGRKLGQMLAGVAVNLLNLEGVVIGGGVSASLDLMRPVLERELFRRGFDFQTRRFKIRGAQLGDDAGIIGAAICAGGEHGD